MLDAFKRGVFGTFWCYPMFYLLWVLEERYLVMIYPWETAIILTAWMTVGWGAYEWLKRNLWLPRIFTDISRILKK